MLRRIYSHFRLRDRVDLPAEEACARRADGVFKSSVGKLPYAFTAFDSEVAREFLCGSVLLLVKQPS